MQKQKIETKGVSPGFEQQHERSCCLSQSLLTSDYNVALRDTEVTGR
jgi:hypothetical protein